MRLCELAELVGGRIRGDGAVELHGIYHDSRKASPGGIFVCLVGERFDGHEFARDALARGAAALCVDSAHEESMPVSVPALIVEDTRRALPALAAAIHGYPSRRLLLIGVTGTNGKTTTTLLIAAILRAAGYKVGTIGTLGAELMGEWLDSERTTPEADQLQALLAEMHERDGRAMVMEVSSHALDQHRTEGCEFDAAVFTNLSVDHLDWHGTLDSYFESKKRLFTTYPVHSEKPFVASVNLDDPRGGGLAKDTVGRVVTYAVSHPADVTGSNIELKPDSVRFTAKLPTRDLPIRLNIGGAFQVNNALGAIAVAVGLGIPLAAVAEGLESVRAIPGRFESVPTDRGFHVVVDYAHTPDGLENLLRSARRLNPNRVIAVFGCGGDRDRTKRPIMGRLAGELADVAVVTSDNPRTESPDVIIQEILPGLNDTKARVLVEADRRKAIGIALREARKNDMVLIAGKGHETYQIVNGVEHPFDDRIVARELLAEMEESP